MNLEFLGSNRFWALVISSLVVVAEGNFTTVAWLSGLKVLVTGFIAIRTIDRAGEKVGNK